MPVVKFNLNAFDQWVAALIAGHKVFGVQVKADSAAGLSGETRAKTEASAEADKFTFAELKRAEDLRLDYDVTLSPPKYYFQPPCETLLKFSSSAEFESVFHEEEFILLGVHPYDMAAINQMDKIFSTGEYDAHYLARRKKALIIGVDVQTASRNVFAGCLDTAVVRQGFDILLTRVNAAYLAEALTAAGQALLPNAPGMEAADAASLEQRARVWENNRRNLRRHELRVPLKDLPALLERSYHHPVWQEKAEKCFSCGSCNLVCPTCYCFDVRDDLHWDLRSGARRRVWDGCMLRDFATVAGGHNFRKKKLERYRHRYYRKGQYVPAKIGEIACIGCGRCITVCVTRIAQPVEVYNRLLEPK